MSSETARNGLGVREILFGRSAAVSIATVVLASVLAVATALWTGATVGADQFAEWTVSTWTGESSHEIVFLTAAALVVLGAAVAAFNSGLIPTFVLVASPLFGVGLARLGTESVVAGTTHTVSLGEAAADATGAAVVIGIPLAVAGFLLGVGIRRTMRGLSGGPSQAPRAH